MFTTQCIAVCPPLGHIVCQPKGSLQMGPDRPDKDHVSVNVLFFNLTRLGCQLVGETCHHPKIFVCVTPQKYSMSAFESSIETSFIAKHLSVYKLFHPWPTHQDCWILVKWMNVSFLFVFPYLWYSISLNINRILRSGRSSSNVRERLEIGKKSFHMLTTVDQDHSHHWYR